VISLILTTCCTTDYRLSLLKLSIKSLRDNTIMKDKQWIICDNGDNRQTEYLKTLKPDRHIVFNGNKGIAHARNAGADASTGNYICFIDGDLVYRPNWMRTLKRLLDNDSRKLIASGMVNESAREGYRYAIDHSLHWQLWAKANSGCLLMKRSTWEEVGPWADFWKLGSSFHRKANKKRYKFIIPTPEVVFHLDSKPSYNKKKLQLSHYRKQPPIWEMLT